MASHKPVIAVDFDEVLFPLSPTFLNYYNEHAGTSYTTDQMESYYLEHLTGEPVEVILKKLEAYLATEHHHGSQPVPGAVEAIKQLSQKYKLVVVTARIPFFSGHTERFLDTYFKGVFEDIHNIYRDDIEHHNHSKAEVCKAIEAVALIDDHLNYVLDAAKHGVNCLLFGDYAWNRADDLPPNVTRVKNWPAVLEYFDGRAGR